MNLLIIEDDMFLSEKIKIIFNKKQTFNFITQINSFEDFLNKYYMINIYDVILVDILLWNSKKNWIDIIHKIRSKNIKIPIVIISWLNDIKWLRLAFNAWANDYICKPFRIIELEIRILKRFNKYLLLYSSGNKTILKYNKLEYSFSNNSFFINNNVLKLSKTNKYILLLFISQNEKLLTEIYLIEKIWWDSNIVDRNLRVTISRLKKWLREYWIDNWVKNIRWEWYIFKK